LEGHTPVEDQRIEVSTLDSGHSLITLNGDFDVADGSQLAAVVQLAFSMSEHTVLDMGQVTFMDSTLVNCLVDASRTAEARRGSFTVVNPSRLVLRLLELTRLDTVLSITTTVAAATELSTV
jgi:anti-anti-sigma factor